MNESDAKLRRAAEDAKLYTLAGPGGRVYGRRSVEVGPMQLIDLLDRLEAAERDAKITRTIRRARGDTYPGISCCCEFDTKDGDRLVQECNAHADVRQKRDDYLARVIQLKGDLERVNAELTALRAAVYGGTPEASKPDG